MPFLEPIESSGPRLEPINDTPSQGRLEFAETPQEIRARYQSNPSLQPSYMDAKALYDAEQKRSTPDKVTAGVQGFGSGLLNAGKSFLKSAKGGIQEVAQDWGKQSVYDPNEEARIKAMSNEEQEAYLKQHPNPVEKMWGSAADAYGRMFKGLNALGQKAYLATADRANPQGDPVAQYQARWTADLQKQRELAQKPGIVPPEQIYPELAEAGSYVVSPPGLGAAAGLFGKGTKAEVAGAGALSKAAGAVGRGAEKVGELAKAPANKLADLERTVVGDTTAASQALRTPAIPVVLGARATKKGTDAVEQVGRTVGDSELSRLEQVGMSESAPQAVRKAAQLGTKIGADAALDTGIDVAKAGAQGAAINTALTVPGAETPEEVGDAAGAGAAIGGLTHLALAPSASKFRQKQAQAADVMRWESSKDPQEQAAISAANVPHEVKLKFATAEAIANGILDQNANVKFLYGDTQMAQQLGVGAQRGAAYIDGDRPTIFINTDKMTASDGRSAFHELWHQISRSPEIVDYPGVVTKLIGVRDSQGNVLKPGVLDDPAIKTLGDTYYNQLDTQAQETLHQEKQVFDLNPADPKAADWRNRIVSEVGAEMFANLASDTKGNLLKAVDTPLQKVLDGALLQTKSESLQKLGQKVSSLFGRDPQTDSDIFPGLRATPEIYATMREYVRNKKGLTETPAFEGPMVLDTETKLDPKAVAKDAALLQKFSDNDIFVKNPDGSIRMQNGAPVMRNERAIKAEQNRRAALMVQALDAVQSQTPGAVQASVLGTAGAAPATPSAGSTPTQKGKAYVGRFFDQAQMQALQALPDDVLTPSMKDKLQKMNRIAEAQDGTPFMVWYNAATKNKKYSSTISESVRSAVPLTMNVSKAGNFLVTALDLTVLNQKVQRWAGAKPQAFADFNGSQSVFFEKLKQALDNHQKGLPGATNLDPDPVKARKMFLAINDVINIRDIASEMNNPQRLSKKTGDDNLIRSFRFDRINRIEASPTNEKFPIDYGLQKQVFSPDPNNPENAIHWFDYRDTSVGKKLADVAAQNPGRLMVFHGGEGGFSKFDPSMIGSNFKTGNIYGAGFYFTPSLYEASGFASLKEGKTPRENGRVAAFFLDLKHPAMDADLLRVAPDFYYAGPNSMALPRPSAKVNAEQIRTRLLTHGFDGVLAKNGTEAVAFDPASAKPIKLSSDVAQPDPNVPQKTPEGVKISLPPLKQASPVELKAQADALNEKMRADYLAKASARPTTPSPEAPQEIPTQTLDLYHGTKTPFDKFEVGKPNRWGKSTTDRIYMSSEPEAAFDAARPGKGARQVDVAKYATTLEDYGLFNSDEFYDLEPADQSKIIESLKGELGKMIDMGGTVISTRDDGAYGIVTKDDLAKFDMDQLDSSLVFSKNSKPRILKSQVSGKVLDLTHGQEIPKPLAEALKAEGRWNRETDHTGFGHEYSKALIDWARKNGYQLIKVPENYATGGQSRSSWIVLPEALPQKFEDVFEKHVGPYNKQKPEIPVAASTK